MEETREYIYMKRGLRGLIVIEEGEKLYVRNDDRDGRNVDLWLRHNWKVDNGAYSFKEDNVEFIAEIGFASKTERHDVGHYGEFFYDLQVKVSVKPQDAVLPKDLTEFLKKEGFSKSSKSP